MPSVILNKNVFASLLLPLGIILFASLCCGFYLFSQRTPTGKKTETAVAFQSPFALLPALKIGAFFVFALFITKLLQALLGSSGIYFASFLAGFADIDAVVISMVTLASAGEITSPIAALGIVLAALSNTITKAAIAYLFGGKQFAKKVLICTAIILAAGIVAVLVL